METATKLTDEQVREAKDILLRAEREGHPFMDGFFESRAGDKERREYWGDVRGMAESIEAEFREQAKRDEWTSHDEDTAREWLNDHIYESIDGCARVIYTYQAKLCLVYSQHEGRYLEEFGAEGAVDGDCLNWSALAFAAFEGDVMDSLDVDELIAELPEFSMDEDEDDDEPGTET